MPRPALLLAALSLTAVLASTVTTPAAAPITSEIGMRPALFCELLPFLPGCPRT